MIGAGAFGGWTAWHLARRGARVVLLDAWGAGHPRGTSSGESRILRFSYGEKSLYSEWTHRAREVWRECEAEWNVSLFSPCGMLWILGAENDYSRASVATLNRLKEPWERLGAREVAQRFPQIALEPEEFALYEPGSGFLRAQRAVQAVAAQVERLGGEVRIGWAEPPGEGASGRGRTPLRRGAPLRLDAVQVTRDGAGAAGRSELRAGTFVFACGPWLPRIFPGLLGRRIVVTRQDVFYFGAPPGDARFDAPQLPAWADYETEFYGTPGCDVCGFKIANNQGEPGFDPTAGERVPAAATLEAARAYLARRFPAMRGAPLVRARVCQYERTPDSHVVLDRHPEWENVWVAGGGSGHGFKFGPALGEFLAGLVLDGGQERIPAPLRLGASAHSETGELREKGAY
ncbi:MAG TPA: FAD-dependent oxidoreductase [Candidatus Acidoferrales bacterium]|nr:FAD-dependent oxidoreductase [Candidatus Acidoferrales bacterium]